MNIPTLRPYQAEAKAAVYAHLRERDDNPCIVMPTGSGKTPVIASICDDVVKQWYGRALILAHVKELLEQSADKLQALNVPCGIYSAGLGRRETNKPVTIAGIQSVYPRACDLGRFDLVFIDEAQLVPPDGEGMYRQLLSELKVINPRMRFIGLTATPFRLSSGPICTPDGYLNHVCYEVGVRQLIVDGYLSPLISKRGDIEADTSGLHIRGGEYIAGELEALMDDERLVRSACAEIVELTRDRKSVLIFCAGVQHAEDVSACLSLIHGFDNRIVTAETPAGERKQAVEDFKAGRLKYLLNVNCFTTGFDAPGVDCVVLLRPTLSPGLYYQMVGRGFRLAEGKANCLVLDYGGNVKRHGPVDMLKTPGGGRIRQGDAVAKDCPECNAVIAAGYSACPVCGYEFPPPERTKHDERASEAGVLSGEVTVTRYDVQGVNYSVWHKKNAPEGHPPTMRVAYEVGPAQYKMEWISFEGRARDRGVRWWSERSPDPVPLTVAAAVNAANSGSLADTLAISITHVEGRQYDEITNHELGSMPEPLDGTELVLQGEECPF